MLTNELESLLIWGMPKMTEAGQALFKELLEEAVGKVVRQAFDERDLASFGVKRMVK